MATGLDVIAIALGEVGYDLERGDTDSYGRYRFTVGRGEDTVAEGKFYPGNDHIDPWIEVRAHMELRPGDEDHRSFFEALASCLEPGSHIMVPYMEHDRTAEQLNVDVPVPATPLGFLLWNAGFHWFKDWYIAEGFREGGQKIQANLPVDEETRREHEQQHERDLEEFIASNPDRRARDLAEAILSRIG